MYYSTPFLFFVGVSVSFYLLGVSILLVFFPYKTPIIKVPLWCISCFIAVLFGYIGEIVSIQGVAMVLVYACLLFAALTLRSVWPRRIAVVAFPWY